MKRHYALDQWTEAINVADELMANGWVRDGQLAETLAFKARCLVHLSRLEEAKAAFKSAHKIDETLSPDPASWTPEEIAVYREATKGGIGKWTIALATGAVVGLIALLRGDGPPSTSGEPLPWPPFPPAVPTGGR